MKLKMFANILFALIITITASYSQDVWPVGSPSWMYFDMADNDAKKDTLASGQQLPSWLTPQAVKLGMEHPGELIPVTSRSQKKYKAFGFAYEEVKIVQSTSYVDGIFTDPTIAVITDVMKINYIMIVFVILAIGGLSVGAYSLSAFIRLHKDTAIQTMSMAISLGIGTASTIGLTIVMYSARGSIAFVIGLLFFCLLFVSAWMYSKKKNPSPKFRVPIL